MPRKPRATTTPSWDDTPGYADPTPVDEPDLEDRRLTRRESSANNLPALCEAAERLQPRNLERLLAQARKIGAMLGKIPASEGVGTAAYYDWTVTKKSGAEGRVTGPTVGLMQALASEWGRLLVRTIIVEQDATSVVLRAQVADLVSLTVFEVDYPSSLSPAPGKMGNSPEQAQRWRIMQINAAGSKAIRGALLDVLPAWYVEAAMDSARSAARKEAKGDGTVEAKSKAIAFFQKCEITREMIEALIGRPAESWTEDDLVELRNLKAKLVDAGDDWRSVARQIRRDAEVARGGDPGSEDDSGEGGSGAPADEEAPC